VVLGPHKNCLCSHIKLGKEKKNPQSSTTHYKKSIVEESQKGNSPFRMRFIEVVFHTNTIKKLAQLTLFGASLVLEGLA